MFLQQVFLKKMYLHLFHFLSQMHFLDTFQEDETSPKSLQNFIKCNKLCIRSVSVIVN